jgi:hypothetical protein
MATLNQQGIVYGDGSTTTTDPLRIVTVISNRFPLSIGDYDGTRTTVGHEFSRNSAVTGGAPRGSRTCYRQRLDVTVDEYNSVYSFTYLGLLQIPVVNYSTTSSLVVNIEHGVWDMTDDSTGWSLYRGGSVASATSHSGGTLVHDSGWASRPGSEWDAQRTVITTEQTISPGAEEIFTLYSGIQSGSGADALRGFMTITFNRWQ